MCSSPKGSSSLAKRRTAASDYEPVFSPGTGALYGVPAAQPRQRSSGDSDSTTAVTPTARPGDTAGKKLMWQRVKENLAVMLR